MLINISTVANYTKILCTQNSVDKGALEFCEKVVAVSEDSDLIEVVESSPNFTATVETDNKLPEFFLGYKND